MIRTSCTSVEHQGIVVNYGGLSFPQTNQVFTTRQEQMSEVMYWSWPKAAISYQGHVISSLVLFVHRIVCFVPILVSKPKRNASLENRQSLMVMTVCISWATLPKYHCAWLAVVFATVASETLTVFDVWGLFGSFCLWNPCWKGFCCAGCPLAFT